MADLAISVQDVSKRYLAFDSQRARLRNMLQPSRTEGASEIWALRDIGFEIARGEAVGIIGRNGSGKSTLLEIITQTLTPTTGAVQVQGRVAALLQLGSGFKPDYTGRENVFLNGMLLGLSRAEMENRFDEIAAFADIGDVLDRPVKTYSSGMLVRLAFAVQVAIDPDILIIDEALSVGDYFFRQKCFGRLRQLRDQGLTLLFVTHDTGTVTNICNRVLYLQKGRLRHDGDPYQGVRAYLGQDRDAEASSPGSLAAEGRAPELLQQELPEEAQWRRAQGSRPGPGGLLAVRILNSEGELATSVRMKETIRVQVYFAPDPECRAHIYLRLKNRFDQIVFTTGTYFLDLPIVELQQNQLALAEFELEMSLGGGGYSLLVIMGYPEPPNRMGAILDQTGPIGPVVVEGRYEHEKVPFLGPFGLPVSARLIETNIGR
ncbi:MAG: lipopolysaccharide transport system ATP-binding protein [Pseudomonadota bacterium]|nr:lipopolysaccharide transport system ATP-binding protein [Pseudomonadota bacterium]